MRAGIPPTGRGVPYGTALAEKHQGIARPETQLEQERRERDRRAARGLRQPELARDSRHRGPARHGHFLFRQGGRRQESR